MTHDQTHQTFHIPEQLLSHLEQSGLVFLVLWGEHFFSHVFHGHIEVPVSCYLLQGDMQAFLEPKNVIKVIINYLNQKLVFLSLFKYVKNCWCPYMGLFWGLIFFSFIIWSTHCSKFSLPDSKAPLKTYSTDEEEEEEVVTDRVKLGTAIALLSILSSSGGRILFNVNHRNNENDEQALSDWEKLSQP